EGSPTRESTARDLTRHLSVRARQLEYHSCRASATRGVAHERRGAGDEQAHHPPPFDAGLLDDGGLVCHPAVVSVFAPQIVVVSIAVDADYLERRSIDRL